MSVEKPVGYQEPHKQCRDKFSLTFYICATPVSQSGVKLRAEQAWKGSLLFSGGGSVSSGR